MSVYRNDDIQMEFPCRESHLTFFEERQWSWVEDFWREAVQTENEEGLPLFVRGDEQFGLTNLSPIHAIGRKEFVSNDPRYRRQTFALRVGYVGGEYHGFQRQHSSGEEAKVATVEDDLQKALGRNINAAGRTDRGVSAVSQVISFVTYDPVTPSEVIAQLRTASPFSEGKLAVWQCLRVPKRFHALFSATWRRYLYLFPLNPGAYPCRDLDVDVDIDFIQRCLSKLENLSLSYNGFAHRDSRQSEDGQGDICVLRRCVAQLVHLRPDRPALSIELVGSRFLRRMVRLIVATAVRESVLPNRDEDVLLVIARTGRRARASLSVPGAGLALAGVGYDLEDLEQHKHRPAGYGLEAFEGDEVLEAQSAPLLPPPKKARLQPSPPSAPAVNFAQLMSAIDLGVRDAVKELVASDGLRLHYPERAFRFSEGLEIVLENNIAEVARTIWDAEVLLAHVLDRMIVLLEPSITLELGAGTALAAAVTARRGRGRVCVQEIDESTVAHSLACLRAQGVEEDKGVGVAGRWGRELVSSLRAACRVGQFDLLVAADVLYHSEDFPALLYTIYQLAAPHSVVLLVYEQRRKDLSAFVAQIAKLFAEHHELSHRCIDHTEAGDQVQEGDAMEGEDTTAVRERETVFFVHVFGRKIAGRKLPTT